MIPKLKTAALVAAAAGTPYVATETDWGRDLVSDIPGISATADAFLGSSDVTVSHAHHEVEQLRRDDPTRYRYDDELATRLGGGPSDPKTTPRLVGPPIGDLREVIRFDIGPDWVLSRFSRVSTVLSDMKMEGLRVPMVTGTQAADLAGTLTYYFDRSNKLQRVTIHGFTGDPSRLVGLMTQYYGLKTSPSLEAGVYVRSWNGTPTSFLRLSHAPVVYSDAVHQKYTVFLELNDPNLAFGISPEARKIVQSDRGSGRW